MIYLDNAATSWPKPEEVYHALDDFARNSAANPGKGGHRMAQASAKVMQEVREGLARLLHAPDPTRMVLTLNATDALNMALKGILEKGDHVVSTVLEHDSVSRPLMAMQRRGEISVTWVEPEEDISIAPGKIKAALTPQTKLIAITHASNVVGTINPVEELVPFAHEKGVRVLVDASQTVGIVDLNVEKSEIDLVAFTGHKNLFGTMGTGGLYVREGIALRPWREGASGADPDLAVQPEEMPDRMEAGTPNAHGFAALHAGLKFIQKKGVEQIHEYKTELAFNFLEAVQGHPRIKTFGTSDPKRSIGSVCLNIEGVLPREAGVVFDDKYKIACRPGLHCAAATHRFLGTFPNGTIRFSFGLYNTIEHAALAGKAVSELAGPV